MSTASSDEKQPIRLALHVAALGVVFGDIGTSPLYTIRECFDAKVGLVPNDESVLGVLSLVFWAQPRTIVPRCVEMAGESEKLAVTFTVSSVAASYL